MCTVLQVDAVKLIGSLDTPAGVVRSVGSGLSVEYVPDPLVYGTDSFSYVLTDCAYQETRQTEPRELQLHVLPVSHPPVIRLTTFSVSSKDCILVVRVMA